MPTFSFVDFLLAGTDLLNTHPLLFVAGVLAAALVVWKLTVLIGLEWEIRAAHRASRRAQQREQAQRREATLQQIARFRRNTKGAA